MEIVEVCCACGIGIVVPEPTSWDGEIWVKICPATVTIAGAVILGGGVVFGISSSSPPGATT